MGKKRSLLEEIFGIGSPRKTIKGVTRDKSGAPHQGVRRTGEHGKRSYGVGYSDGREYMRAPKHRK